MDLVKIDFMEFMNSNGAGTLATNKHGAGTLATNKHGAGTSVPQIDSKVNSWTKVQAPKRDSKVNSWTKVQAPAIRTV